MNEEGNGQMHSSEHLLIFLQIEKFGDPNGIVQFSEDALQERVYSEPSKEEGALNISLSVKRREGVMGNITVGRHQYSFSERPKLLKSCTFFETLAHLLSHLRYAGGSRVTLT